MDLRPPPDLIPGLTLLDLVGSGTSGSVYRARRSEGQEVAVKLLAAADPRFEREVEVLQRLSHPAILKVIGHGRAGERPYLITELVQGTSLDGLLPLGVLGPAALVEVCASLAGALEAAHGAGVLHRDVKPANVIVDADMRPRLIDFGLAAFAAGGERLTRTGTAVGTPLYMAPEVLEHGAQRASPASDVYALGVILHEGLATKHPYYHPDWKVTLQRVREGRAPALPSGIAPGIGDACRAAMHLDPARRPSAAELRAKLEGTRLEPSSKAAAPVRASGIRGRQVGAHVGPYVVERVLGQGGMGSVFLGRHTESSLRHALKVVRSRKRTHRERLEREARALAQLSGHPHVVGVHHYAQLQSGEAFFALDYVEGTDLERALADGHLELERARRIGRDVADALAHVHTHGVVHRDVKPANVLLRAEDDTPLLTDFGLVLDPEHQRLTASHAIVGTPCYMAPEQAFDRGAVGPKADVFALGVVLYQMVCGQLPFQGDQFVALVQALMNEDPAPPRSHRPDLPVAFEEVILWALEKDPEHRPSAAELRDALDAAGRGERPSQTGRAGRLARRFGGGRLVLVSSAVALILLLAGLVWILGARDSRRAAWEADARAALEDAREDLRACDLSSLEVYAGGGDEGRGQVQLASHQSRLRALATAAPAGSDVGAELQRTVDALDAATARSHAEASLVTQRTLRLAGVAAGDAAALELIGSLRAGEAPDLAAFTSRLDGLEPGQADRLRLALGLGFARAGQVEAASAQLAGLRAEARAAGDRVRAELAVGRTVAAARAGNVVGVQDSLAEAGRLDPRARGWGGQRVVEALVERWRAGADPVALVPVLDALNGPRVSFSDSAPIYLAAADVLTKADEAVQPGVQPARLLERGLKIDPTVKVSKGLLTFLTFRAVSLLGKARWREGLQVLRACTRAGIVIGSATVRFHTLKQLRQSGAVDDLVRSDPDDWANLAWRGYTAYAILRLEGGRLPPAEQRELAEQANADFAICLERTEPRPTVRAAMKVYQLHCLARLDRDAIRGEVERLEAQEGFPEMWRVYRMATLHYRDREPRLALRYAREYVKGFKARMADTAAGRLEDDMRGVDSVRLDAAYETLFNTMLVCGEVAEARELVQDPDVELHVPERRLRELRRRAGLE